MAAIKALGLMVVGALLAAVAVVAYVVISGISARSEPGEVETFAARRIRGMAIGARARSLPNPVPATPETLAEGRAHFADHCAICHGNDGSGDTATGRGLWPRPPDMRQETTQNLTDGELFSIIENGVRLTGMPAFGTGTPESEEASWRLVHFVRHLPAITAAEIDEMVALNPKPAEEWRRQTEIERFLEGGESATPPTPEHER